ncbi:glycosyltransferase family 2 protein [Candidatus Omnitrophota bacterium]
MISVVIPTFNRAPFLKKAIESVLSQSYQDFELIIVDDGSQDKTHELIARYASRIVYIKQRNKGPSAARNLGLQKSKGEFIAFLDSDDWWKKEKLATQICKMQQNPYFLVSHTEEIWHRKGVLLNQKKKHKKFPGHIFDKCLPMCVVSMSTAMIRRRLFDDVGFFDETLACCEDYDFWLRASIKHQFLLIDEPLTLKEGGRPDQVSYIHARRMDRFRIASIAKVLGSGALSHEQEKASIHELRKKCRIYGTGCIKHGREEEGKYYLSLPDNLKNPQ